MPIDRDPTLEPEFAEAHRLDEAGHHREAEREFLAGLARHPDYAFGWASLGILRRLKLDDASGAADCFRRVVELCPSEVEVGVSLFHSLLDAERYVEAKPEARRLLDLHDGASARLHPDHVQALRDWVDDAGELEREDARLHRVARLGVAAIERALASAPNRARIFKDIALADHPQALHFLGPALRSDNAETRAAAVHAIGLLGEPSNVTLLAGSLQDVDPIVRRAALGALSDSEGGVDFVTEMIACLDDGDDEVRASAARAIGIVGSSDQRALLELRLSAESSEIGRIGLLEGLYGLTGESRYIDAMVDRLSADSGSVRSYASVALSRIATRDTAGELGAALEAAVERETDLDVRALMKDAVDDIRATSRERK